MDVSNMLQNTGNAGRRTSRFSGKIKKIINGKNLNINTHFPLFKFFNVFKANLVRIFGERICDVCNCCYTVDRGRS
jgi:hypothetical protein